MSVQVEASRFHFDVTIHTSKKTNDRFGSVGWQWRISHFKGHLIQDFSNMVRVVVQDEYYVDILVEHLKSKWCNIVINCVDGTRH